MSSAASGCWLFSLFIIFGYQQPLALPITPFSVISLGFPFPVLMVPPPSPSPDPSILQSFVVEVFQGSILGPFSLDTSFWWYLQSYDFTYFLNIKEFHICIPSPLSERQIHIASHSCAFQFVNLKDISSFPNWIPFPQNKSIVDSNISVIVSYLW